MKNFDKNAIYCSFKDNTIFSIFFNEIKLFGLIVNWLERLDMEPEVDEDENEVEHNRFRKIYYQLKMHN